MMLTGRSIWGLSRRWLPTVMQWLRRKVRFLLVFPLILKNLIFKYCFSFLILGLDCVLLFTENCKSATKVVGEVKKKTDLLCGEIFKTFLQKCFQSAQHT